MEQLMIIGKTKDGIKRRKKMIKKILLVLSLLFTFSCEDNIVEEESSMKLWLNGEEVDVEATYEKITTYGEEVEYYMIQIVLHTLKRY